MASEIRANSITSRAGLSTVTMTDSGPMFSGITTFVDNSGFTFGVGGGTSIFTPATNILTLGTNNTEKVRIDANGNANITGVTTAANFKTGVSNLHNAGLTLTGGQIDVGSNIKIGTAGVVTATSFVGSGANLTGITQTTINSNTNNYLITGTGTANTLQGEANLTFDGTTLYTVGDYMVKDPSTASYVTHTFSSNFAKIDVRGTNIANSNHYLIGYGAGHGSANQLHLVNTVGNLVLRTSGGNGITLDSSGNVEVLGKLTFAGDGHTKGIELGANADLVLYHDDNDAYFDNNKGDFYIRNDGNSTSEVLRLQAKGGEQSITCTPNGNVSLYYDNSRKLFTNSGGVTVESTGNTPKVQFRGASNLDMGKIDVDQFATNYSMMRFFSLANGTQTEWMRLLDNGNFCVGGMVGSSNNGNIQSPGQGNGNTNVGSAMWTEGRFICNSASSFSSFGRNSSGTVLSFTRQGGDQGAISVAVGSVSYGSGSDYRLKENVVSLTDGITRVKQLVPKRFNFIEDTTNTLRDGFLAHEVSSIVPEAITGTKDAVDSDDNPVYQQIDQAKLVPLLTAALQEAITRIETLEQEKIALRVRVTNLEGN